MNQLDETKKYHYKRVQQFTTPFKYYEMECLICGSHFKSRMGLEKACYNDDCRKEWFSFYKRRMKHNSRTAYLKKKKEAL